MSVGRKREIVETVSQQVESVKPCLASSTMKALIDLQMRESFEAMADDMITNGEQPPEPKPLTREGIQEIIHRYGLGEPRNPFPPEHPLHVAWSFASSVESGDFVKIPREISS